MDWTLVPEDSRTELDHHGHTYKIGSCWPCLEEKPRICYDLDIFPMVLNTQNHKSIVKRKKMISKYTFFNKFKSNDSNKMCSSFALRIVYIEVQTLHVKSTYKLNFSTYQLSISNKHPVNHLRENIACKFILIRFIRKSFRVHFLKEQHL